MEFRQIDLKTGQELPLPPKTVEHSYLELKIGKDIEPSKLAVGKMYDGITERDIERLQEQGLYLILANGRTAYFGDRQIAEKVSQEIFTNHSDAVAYGSLPVSEAKTSIFKEQARILIIDDETLSQDSVGTYSADWGQQPITLSNGITISDKAMGLIASKLGDCYSLISPDLATQLQAEPNRPFQYRAAVPEWQGVIKGTCRASLLCQALEVDGIIAKSSIKGDNKTTTTGIHEISLFWSRKEDARFTEQKLGTQALVFFPEGVQADVLPKLKIKAERLAEAQSDPRKIAQLYIERHEKRQQQRQEEIGDRDNIKQIIEPELALELGLSQQENTTANEIKREQVASPNEEYQDWLYDILKTDLIEGGHCQILEMEDIAKRLREFLQSEWQEVATGGVYVPSGIAQPHNQLQEGEVSFTGLPDGSEVAIYRSPVANAANFDVFTNNLTVLRELDPEAYKQRGVCYLNPNDAKRLVIDFDGDRVGIIPSELTPEQQASSQKIIEQYPTLIQEIIDKNLPENKPIQVEKEKKIPRDIANGFATLASAAVNAADNPTGRVANLGMRLEALRWETQYIPESERSEYLQDIGKHFQKLLAEDKEDKKPFRILNESWRNQIVEISQIASTIPKLPEQEKANTVTQGLAKTERLLWNLESIAAVNLQRAVDTPKSARKVNEDEFQFCQKVAKYKQVEWIKDKDNSYAYIGTEGIKTNTQDPVGWMVEQANQIYKEYSLIGDRNYNRFDHIFPKDSHTSADSEWAKSIATQYNKLISEAAASRSRLEHEEGIALTATSSKGNKIEIVSVISTDPDGESPIWEMARKGETVDIQIAKNKDWKTEKQYSYKAVALIDQSKIDVGLISPATVAAYDKAIEKDKIFGNLKLEFKLGISKNDVDDKFAAAEKYLETQRDAIPEAERERRTTALWHNNNRAIAGKMFTQVVANRLQELQLEKIKVIGLQYETNELKDRQWQPHESLSCRMAIEANPHSPIYDKRVIQVQIGDQWKNMGVVHNDAAYMPIGSQFTANIHVSASKKDADLEIDKNTLKLPEIWHGLSSERVKEAVNLDVIAPQLKEAITKASANQPTVTEFVAKLADENVGLKAQVQTGGRINGITYLYEGQAIKASLIELSWKNLAAMGVNYDPERDREALTTPTTTVQTETNTQSESLMEMQKSSTHANPLEKIESQLRESVRSHFDSEQPVKITGKPVKMVYPLKMHGEVNPLPVNTCIEAMRGHGRCHTTRRYEPYAAYGFKEGDIAIAIAGEQKVAFKVGKQYKITPEMLNDAAYQQQWSQMEKHSAKELTTFQGHSNTWGMHFQPLGDYVNGKIMPFPTEPIKADNTIVADIQQLMEWSRIAEYLGKSEKYIDRIQELIAGESITEKAQQAMHKDHHTLSQHVASQWREILAIKSDYVESQDGKLVFERKGNEGKYRATWEQDTDTLTLDAKVLNQGKFQYSPLLVQQGLEITHSQVTMKDAKNCDRALQLIAESQKEYQESR
ncbi:hypothetical protein [Pseudanabaena sp. ABRG5-3]|uniref:hypothetical protein n=1 Tax=Pseudanabaena sp. ABRG5-3 TaxID=685565 RepID=UPI000DC6F17B|nr:hypothetical protein [Pseudanabaena sp. ABRG5-3]BBC26812.1 RNase H [Pseudanabaena sp. ABRG5-3]